MDGSLYEQDFYSWTQQQAAALRRLAAERANLGAELDLPHLIEEVADLGSEQVHAVSSNLRQMLTHLIMVASRPDHTARNHWQGEVATFQANAADRYLPSMRQQVEPRLDRNWAAARKAAGLKLGDPLAWLPTACPYRLDELLNPDTSVDALAERLRPTPSEP